MNEIQILIEVAKIDGWKFCDRVTDKHSGHSWDVYSKNGKRASLITNTIPHYSQSFDSILTVLNNQPGTIQRAVERGINESGITYFWAATPLQLCELLVKASGNWKT